MLRQGLLDRLRRPARRPPFLPGPIRPLPVSVATSPSPRSARLRRLNIAANGLALLLALAASAAQAQIPSLDNLPRPKAPPLERGPVLPVQVERWRQEAKALEHGDGIERDAVRAAELYCRAARFGDAESQYSLAWMLTNARGIERDEAQAAHLFQAAAEQGYEQAQNILARMGKPQGPPPACLRPPEEDRIAVAAQAAQAALQRPPAATAKPGAPLTPSAPPAPPPPANAPEPIVRFVNLVAPEYKLPPHLVLAIMATESNFDPTPCRRKTRKG